jgi:hypothetical protein
VNQNFLFMREIIFIFAFAVFSSSAFAQQPASQNQDPHVFFKKQALQIEPAGWVITFYHVSLLKKGKEGLVGPYTFSRGKASKQAVSLLQSAKPGDKLFIDEIKAKGPDGKTFSLGPITTNLE